MTRYIDGPPNMDEYHAAQIETTGPDAWGQVTGLPSMRPISPRKAARRYRRTTAAGFDSRRDDSIARGVVVAVSLLAFVCVIGLVALCVATGMGWVQ